jgi:hypothetical protein
MTDLALTADSASVQVLMLVSFINVILHNYECL